MGTFTLNTAQKEPDLHLNGIVSLDTGIVDGKVLKIGLTQLGKAGGVWVGITHPNTPNLPLNCVSSEK